MRTWQLVLALSLATPTAAEELQVVPHPAASDEVPEGSREDQLLWKAARDATADAMNEIALMNQALYNLKYARLDLDELEAAPGQDVARLRSIRERLDQPAKALDVVVPRGPGGRCRYVLLHLEQSMSAPPDTDAGKRLPEKRAEARSCATEMAAIADGMRPRVAALREALDAVGSEIRERLAAHRAAHPAATPTSVANPSAAPGPDASSEAPTKEKR